MPIAIAFPEYVTRGFPSYNWKQGFQVHFACAWGTFCSVHCQTPSVLANRVYVCICVCSFQCDSRVVGEECLYDVESIIEAISDAVFILDIIVCCRTIIVEEIKGHTIQIAG